MSKNLSVIGGTAALLVGILFGFNSNIVKMANVNGVETINIILYQLVIGLVYFLIRYLISNSTHKNFTSNIFKNPFNYIAGITTALTGICYYSSIKLTNPSIASLGLFQFPWILFLLGVIFNKEKFNYKHILSIILLWIGSFILIGANITQISFLGCLWGLFAGVSFATNMFTLPKTTNHEFIKVYILAIAVITALFCSVFYIKEISLLKTNVIFYGTIIAILGQIITFELLMFSTKRVSSISMATLTTIELPVAMIVSWVLWGPLPNFMKILGLIITLVSIIWLVYEEYSINKKDG
ncbi:DMT family transporter [Staphylococcus epidermidis]|uniref:DMT family transporter n=1 Tax=Staphylococcus epidermidis TaxID=1282 RepID=UPI00288678BA|nr:DMT family transporter [Staphylococcus epidermidis]MDT0714512.1 DMT family transporter [Staphylococcus epidermidis]